MGKKPTLNGIEFPILTHCNLTCILCDHLAPILPKKFFDKTSILDGIKRCAAELNIAEIKIIGGEPLLHPDIVEIIYSTKRIPGVNRVVLCTNGTLLYKAKNDFWKTGLDVLRISLYPGVSIVGKEYILENSYLNGIEVQPINKVYFNNMISLDSVNSQKSFDSCHVRKWNACFSVVGEIFYPCSVAFPICEKFGFPKEIDTINIYDKNFQKLVRKEQRRKRAPIHCNQCFGSLGGIFPNEQGSKFYE